MIKHDPVIQNLVTYEVVVDRPGLAEEVAAAVVAAIELGVTPKLKLGADDVVVTAAAVDVIDGRFV